MTVSGMGLFPLNDINDVALALEEKGIEGPFVSSELGDSIREISSSGGELLTPSLVISSDVPGTQKDIILYIDLSYTDSESEITQNIENAPIKLYSVKTRISTGKATTTLLSTVYTNEYGRAEYNHSISYSKYYSYVVYAVFEGNNLYSPVTTDNFTINQTQNEVTITPLYSDGNTAFTPHVDEKITYSFSVTETATGNPVSVGTLKLYGIGNTISINVVNGLASVDLYPSELGCNHYGSYGYMCDYTPPTNKYKSALNAFTVQTLLCSTEMTIMNEVGLTNENINTVAIIVKDTFNDKLVSEGSIYTVPSGNITLNNGIAIFDIDSNSYESIAVTYLGPTDQKKYLTCSGTITPKFPTTTE